MQFNLKNSFKVLAIPFALLVGYFVLLAIYKIFDLPAEEELLGIVTSFINQHGLIIILIASFIEGLLLIGNYFPGGTVIFLGVAAAAGDPGRAVLVVGVVCIAFFLSYTINYFLGRHGWYKVFQKFGMQSTLDGMKKRLSRHVFTAIISTYWMPNLAALCSTAAGMMHVPIGKFLAQSTIALVAWNIFWGVFAYFTGDAILTLDLVYFLLIFVVWCILLLGKIFIFNPWIENKNINPR